MAKQNDLDKAYLRMAYVIAELSPAQRKKVGAILVSANGGVIAEGFNGTPAGFDNNCEYQTLLDADGYEWEAVDPNWHETASPDVWMRRDGRRLVFVRRTLKTKPEVLHAESNAIAKVAKSTNSSDGATLYCTLMPCLECAKLIKQAGIRRVVFSEFYPYKGFQGAARPMGLELLEKAKISFEQLDISQDGRQYNDYHDRELEALEPLVPDDGHSFGH